jgi:hypothetical protein
MLPQGMRYLTDTQYCRSKMNNVSSAQDHGAPLSLIAFSIFILPVGVLCLSYLVGTCICACGFTLGGFVA